MRSIKTERDNLIRLRSTFIKSGLDALLIFKLKPNDLLKHIYQRDFKRAININEKIKHLNSMENDLKQLFKKGERWNRLK